ncbi:MAG: hypothetical protein LC650_00580 [Actinobacteria bacterium]|nr:hypothetical protein [Actinomycetota bacterium]
MNVTEEVQTIRSFTFKMTEEEARGLLNEINLTILDRNKKFHHDLRHALAIALRPEPTPYAFKADEFPQEPEPNPYSGWQGDVAPCHWEPYSGPVARSDSEESDSGSQDSGPDSGSSDSGSDSGSEKNRSNFRWDSWSGTFGYGESE